MSINLVSLLAACNVGSHPSFSLIFREFLEIVS